jgi:hypothetical protein
MAIYSRLKRQQGRSSDIASLLSTKSLYLSWRHNLARHVEEGVGEQTMNQTPFPTMVEVCDGEQSTAGNHSGVLHHQTKTFAGLQRMLIQNELVGAAAGRARVHAERGEPDAVTRFRDSGNDADR